MSGRDFRGSKPDSLSHIFDCQRTFQYKVTSIETPVDNIEWFQYHMTAMTEELGEILKADKRWKTHRNTNYEPENKLEEIADAFITLMNISLYSGFSASDIARTVVAKIAENTEKLKKAREKECL